MFVVFFKRDRLNRLPLVQFLPDSGIFLSHHKLGAAVLSRLEKRELIGVPFKAAKIS